MPESSKIKSINCGMRLLLLTFIFALISDASHALWTKMADLPGPGRHRGTGIAIGNKGYIGLGHYNGTGNNIMLDDWWEYDPSNNTWTQKANFPSVNYAPVAFGGSTKGYIGGGITGGSNFYEFDPMQNTWTLKAPLPVSVSDVAGFVVNDKCYYMSGSQIFEYDPAIDTWTTKSPPPIGGGFWNTSFVIGDKGYFQNNSTFYEYKPATDSWLARPAFPGATNSATVGFSTLGKGYIVSGFGGGLSNVSSEFWMFDPNTNSWTQMEDFPGTSRRFASGFNIGNKAYFGIGTNGTNFSDFWCFDLLADTDELEIKDITYFPNPTSNEINIKWTASGTVKVQIIGLNGQIIQNERVLQNKFSTDCSLWPKGNYIVKLINENGNAVSKTITVQ